MCTLVSCASNNYKNESCKKNGEIAEDYLFGPKVSGARSVESYRNGLKTLPRGIVYKTYNRSLRENRDLEGRLIFKIAILGDGTISNIETIHSTIDDCGFVNKIYSIYKGLKFEDIEQTNDKSIFINELEFSGAA